MQKIKKFKDFAVKKFKDFAVKKIKIFKNICTRGGPPVFPCKRGEFVKWLDMRQHQKIAFPNFRHLI